MRLPASTSTAQHLWITINLWEHCPAPRDNCQRLRALPSTSGTNNSVYEHCPAPRENTSSLRDVSHHGLRPIILTLHLTSWASPNHPDTTFNNKGKTPTIWSDTQHLGITPLASTSTVQYLGKTPLASTSTIQYLGKTPAV